MGTLGSFHPVFYEDQAAFVAKGVENRVGHFAGVRKLVVGVDDKYAINGTRGNLAFLIVPRTGSALVTFLLAILALTIPSI